MSVICNNSQRAQKPRGIMSRLARDKRGATLPMMAAAVIPITAMVGAGLDMSRVYLVRTRLQQACDAGAVAVRRSMSATNTASASESNKAEGYKFFDFNFPSGAYGTQSVTRSFAGTTGSNGVGNVDGDASAIVPTSVMKLFAVNTLTVSTSCAATVSVPNTDVMFVLDVSGSMGSKAVSTDTLTKIQGLKAATKSFFTTLGKGSDAGGGRIRYGFVPYSSQANTGAVVLAAGSSYIMGGTTGETAAYQSRTAVTTNEYYITGYSAESAHSPNGTATDTTPSGSSWSDYGSSGSTTIAGTSYTNRFTGITESVCAAKAKPYPSSTPVNSVSTPSGSASTPVLGTPTTPVYPDVVRTNPYTSTQNYDRSTYRYSWKKTGSSSGSDVGTCQFQRLPQTFVRTTPTKTTQNATWATRLAATGWTYGSRSVDVRNLVSGSSIDNPAYWTGPSSIAINANPSPSASPATVSSTVSWTGCLEESSTVNTITASSSLAIPTDALDMKIDLVPSLVSEKWRPFLPQLVFDKTGLSGTSAQWHGDTNWNNNGNSVCPSASRGLRQYTTDVDGTTKLSASFASYVDSLTARGTTQHDIGMIWGARLLSPDGIMASSNSDTTAPGGFAIGRHIVFMTDGIMNADNNIYGPWGISRLDGRQVPTSTASSTMDGIHNQRLKMICSAARSKGFTIWVIGFGMTSSTIPQTLKDCAGDSDHWMAAPTSAELETKFKNIASTIGGLRLTE
jgi:Flp pilus assembly protein TadG